MNRSASRSKLQRLGCGVATAFAISLPGCAAPSWFGGSSGAATDSSAAITQAQANQTGQSPSAFKKASSAVADAFTIEPKVVSAPDATSLSTKADLGPDMYLAAAQMHESKNDSAGPSPDCYPQIMVSASVVKGDSVAKVLNSALDAGEGLLRLTPTQAGLPRSAPSTGFAG